LKVEIADIAYGLKKLVGYCLIESGKVLKQKKYD
jgi:hypothetical protein